MKGNTDIPTEAVVVAVKHQVSCGLAGEAVILHLKNGVYYGLNPVGARIWDLVQQPRTVADLRSLLVQEFDVEPTRCAHDLDALLGELSKHRLIEVRDGTAAQTLSPHAD